VTSYPLLSNASTVCDPMNPAPPVISTLKPILRRDVS
jgi:hypothetical protein